MIRIILPALVVLSLGGCARETPPATGAAEHTEEEIARGPHGGRLLTDGDTTLELLIHEAGVPPEFRAWVTRQGAPVDPARVVLTVELTRLGGRVDRIGFAPSGDFLRGDAEVYEPHSFAVAITAAMANQQHHWTYESFEGRTTIAPEVAAASGIATSIAGPGTLTESLRLFGSIVPDATRVRQVKARFPGAIRAVHKQVGDRVATGEPLAIVESDESLQAYPVTAPIAGVITERHAEPGEQTGSESLFEIADFSRVWAEFTAFPQDRARLRSGADVRVIAGDTQTGARITYVSPVGNRAQQSVVARATLDNAQGLWTPGQFVEGMVTLSTVTLPLVVPLSALQTFRDFTVVFASVGDTYEVRMLELGRRDDTAVEVLGGLEPGTAYVTSNSYLLKADIEKSGASHDH